MDWPIVSTLIVAVAGLVTAIGTYFRNRHDAKVNKTASFDARYEALFSRFQDHLVDPLQTQLTDVRDQLDKISVQFTVLEQRYRSAIQYIRQLRQAFLNSEELPEPPEDIKNEV